MEIDFGAVLIFCAVGTKVSNPTGKNSIFLQALVLKMLQIWAVHRAGFLHPPFLNGRQQSLADEKVGRCIASSSIIIQQAIGRIKSFTILKNTIPIARLYNQIVFVCESQASSCAS